MLSLKILFFAKSRELAGVAETFLNLPVNSSVAELRGELIHLYPKLAGFLELCAVAVDDEFSTDGQILSQDVTVAILPPVSGG